MPRDATDILGITTGGGAKPLISRYVAPDAQRHAARDATDMPGITTGRCEAAYPAEHCRASTVFCSDIRPHHLPNA
jgi:hypothetical protein